MLKASAGQRKARLVRTYLAGHPVWCSWQVTYRCTFRCRICPYWQEPHPAAEELAVEDFERGAANLSRLGTLMVNLAGGEPLLRPDLPAIVEVLSRGHFTFITTNGWRVGPDRAAELWRAGLWGASVSIDYVDEARQDAQRGIPGAFREAVRALEVFRDTRTRREQRVNLMAVLMADNQDEVEALVDLAARLGVNFMVQPYSALKTGDGTPAARPPMAARLLAARRSHRRAVLSNPWFLARFDAALDSGVPGCRAGQAAFNIDQAGRVTKCVEDRRQTVGSIVETPMPVLVERLRRRWRQNRCRACWYNCRGEVEALYTPRGLLSALPILLLDGVKQAAPGFP